MKSKYYYYKIFVYIVFFLLKNILCEIILLEFGVIKTNIAYNTTYVNKL